MNIKCVFAFMRRVADRSQYDATTARVRRKLIFWLTIAVFYIKRQSVCAALREVGGTTTSALSVPSRARVLYHHESVAPRSADNPSAFIKSHHLRDVHFGEYCFFVYLMTYLHLFIGTPDARSAPEASLYSVRPLIAARSSLNSVAGDLQSESSRK